MNTYHAPLITRIDDLVGALQPVRKSFCEQIDSDRCALEN